MYPVMHFKHFKFTESNKSQFNDLIEVPTHLPFSSLDPKQQEIQLPKRSTLVQN